MKVNFEQSKRETQIQCNKHISYAEEPLKAALDNFIFGNKSEYNQCKIKHTIR
jgi:hypothetical protein